MNAFWQDLRFGVRMLSKNPGFALIAIVTLALGIGANTAIFSVADAVLFRPLPYQDSERIVRLEEQHNGATTSNLTYAAFLDLGAETQTLNHIAGWRFWTFNVTENSEPEQVLGAMVSAEFFSALGVAPHTGRAFLPEDDQPNSARSVIIAYGLWQRRFGGEPNLIGKSIRVSDQGYTVIGVMPPGFEFPNQTELWTPLTPGGGLRNNRRSHLLQVIGRLKPGATVDQARVELASIARRIEDQNPGIDPQMSFNAVGLQERIVAPVKPALLVLLCAVGFVLLIACANTANLMLVRAAAREKEIAIRIAVGAGRWRLIRQLLTESALLALLAGGLGLLVAIWAVDLITSFSPANIPRLKEVGIDGRVLGFTLLTAIGSGLLFGLAPALQAARTNLNESLKDGGRSGEGARKNRLRDLLVIGEIALALVLLVGAGLLINSFWRLMQVNPGFNPQNVLTMRFILSPAKYNQPQQQTVALQQMIERIQTVPGVASVGLTSTLPLNGGPATDFEVAGRPAPPAANQPIADIRIIDPNYFRAMSIPLRAGRSFSERDIAQAKTVMIINETMARRFWPDEDAIGKQVTMKDWGPPLTGEIVGVAGDVKPDGLDVAMRPMIYWPYPQFPSNFNAFVIRTTSEPTSVITAVKSKIWEVDKDQAVSAVQTMEELMRQSVLTRRFNMLLLAIFATIALLLAAIGIYGVMSYTVTQRTHEIGVRMALGAKANDVLKLIIRQGMTRALIGVGVGLIAAFALTRLMATLLFGINAADPLTFTLVALLLMAVALVACFLPAWRATKVDPMIALRCD